MRGDAQKLFGRVRCDRVQATNQRFHKGFVTKLVPTPRRV